MLERTDHSRVGLLALGSGAGLCAAACGDGVPVGAVYESLAVSPAQYEFSSTMQSEVSFEVVGPPPDKRSYTVRIVPADAPFEITANTCAGTDLNLSMPCAIGVSFRPLAVGDFRANLVIAAEGKGTTSAMLMGRSLDGCQLDALSPVSFPDTPVTDRSGTQLATIANTGTSTCRLSADLVVEPSAEGPADFEILENHCAGTLEPQEHCDIAFSFAPAQAGLHLGQVVIGPDQQIPMTLAGTALEAGPDCQLRALNPPSFPATQAGLSSAQIGWLVNTGTAPCFLGSLGVQRSGHGPGDFGIQSEDCGDQLAAGQYCSVEIAFSPGTEGEHAGEVHAEGQLDTLLTLQGTSFTCSEGSVANVLCPIGCRLETLTPWSFPDTRIGERSGRLQAWIENTGDLPCLLNADLDVRSAGGEPASFEIVEQDCRGELKPDERCDVAVVFAPQRAGMHRGQLVTKAGQELPFELVGTGMQALTCRLAPSDPADFPDTVVGAQSGIHRAWIENIGTATCALNPDLRIQAAGSQLADFTIREHGCRGELQPGESCDISIVFSPRQEGTHRGALVAGTGQQVPLVLTGAGVVSKCELQALSPAPFPPTQVGLSNVQVGWFVNTGSTPCTLGQLGVGRTGNEPADFEFPPQACGGTLAPGALCGIAITFRPTSRGPHSGVLGATSQPQTPITLTGTATALSDVPRCLKVDVSPPSECTAKVTFLNTTDVECSIQTAYNNGPYESLAPELWRLDSAGQQECERRQFLTPRTECSFVVTSCADQQSLVLAGTFLNFGECRCSR